MLVRAALTKRSKNQILFKNMSNDSSADDLFHSSYATSISIILIDYVIGFRIQARTSSSASIIRMQFK